MSLNTRKCKDWLKELSNYVEETESPRHFWFWSGLFTIAAALQRKVWLPFGIETIFPNLYVLLVAPPGKCRKNSPISLARKMLMGIEVPVSVDSSTKRAITKEMCEIAKSSYFDFEGQLQNHCSLSFISPEMSSLLATDPKAIVELLTDLYGCPEIWAYNTSEKGQDYLHGVCISLFAATTPGWMMDNLPPNAIDGGWASRTNLIYGDRKYKRVTVPPAPPSKVWERLMHDLGVISNIVGPFQWDLNAFNYFDDWYQNMDQRYSHVKDPRIRPFVERIHVQVLKVAMGLHIAQSNRLMLRKDDIGRAILVVEDVLMSCSDALGGHGRSFLGPEVYKVLAQIKAHKAITARQLQAANYRDTTHSELKEVLDTIRNMEGSPVAIVELSNGDTQFKWKEGKEKEK